MVLLPLAFTVLTADNVPGLFLCLATGALFGVVGHLLYPVWGRGRPLTFWGSSTRDIGPTVAMGLVLAAAQYAVTFLGHSMPAPALGVVLDIRRSS